jgi:hypothetical protein
MCYACGAPLKYDGKPGFNDVCDTCGKDMHVCRMCRFYVYQAHWECSETVDEHVVDKEKRNHCEYFVVDKKYYASAAPHRTIDGDDAMRKFNALFGD